MTVKSEIKKCASAARQRRVATLTLALIIVGIGTAAGVVAAEVSDEDLSREVIVAVALVLIALIVALMLGKDGLALVVAVLAFGGFANWKLADLLSDGPPRRAELASCPGADLTTRLAGRIYDEVGKEGAPTYDAAGRDSTPRRRLPAGCALDFTGYCIGQALTDTRYKTPSSVWYVISKREVEGRTRWQLLPGARVSSFTRTIARPAMGDCPGALPTPGSVSLDQPRRGVVGGKVTLLARSPEAHSIGFAVRRAGERWRQIGLDSKQADGFSVVLDSRSLVSPSERGVKVIVAAVPCHAVDMPSRRQTYRRYTLSFAPPSQAKRSTASAAAPTASERTLARREACRNPKI